MKKRYSIPAEKCEQSIVEISGYKFELEPGFVSGVNGWQA